MLISTLQSIFRISNNKHLLGLNLVPKSKNALFSTKICALTNLMMLISTLQSIFRISNNNYLFGPNLLQNCKSALCSRKFWAIANSIMPISKQTFLQYPLLIFTEILLLSGAFIQIYEVNILRRALFCGRGRSNLQAVFQSTAFVCCLFAGTCAISEVS